MNLQTVDKLKHSPLENYIVPGLTSWLISDPSPRGCVRMFEMTRYQEMAIAPHSHRFDFSCLVLAGRVSNTIWRTRTYESNNDHFDDFQMTNLVYLGKPGQYKKEVRGVVKFRPDQRVYNPLDTYHMTRNEIHSINFSKGAKVLFFEGPTVTDTTILLDPYVNGVNVRQSDVLPWMFKASSTHDDHLS